MAFMVINPQLTAFLQRNKLDKSYLEDASKWYASLIGAIKTHQISASTPLLLGVNGCQGSGKSTLADYLSTFLSSEYKMSVAVLSLDDFYYSHQQRKQLAAHEHHLLQTRGVPGTHNLSLANATIAKLQNAHDKSKPVALPRFNKKTDNPYPESEWPKIHGPVDVIILEGWCLGIPAQSDEALLAPINQLETKHDKYGVWRRYVNSQINDHYADLYQKIDILVMLKAPSFNAVYQWRLEQELKSTQAMDEAEVKSFIAYFQRLTEHGLKTLPALCNWVFELDDTRNIVKVDTLELLQPPSYPVIFTDLDGTLLDHYDYSFTPALTTLARLRDEAIPVIPNTSKTYSELLSLRKELALDGPFIVENGAAIYIPVNYFPHQPLGTVLQSNDFQDNALQGDTVQDCYWVKSLVNSRNHWLTLLANTPKEFIPLFTGMSDMTVHEIALATGLDDAGAALASQRQYGEPVLWHGNAEQKQAFIQYLTDQGATVLEGGRFIHVCGDCNKGIAMEWLMSQFQFFNPTQHPHAIALGDGSNDIAMLEVAQHAAIILSPVHSVPILKRKKNVITSNKTGPAGWAEVIPQILNAFYSNTVYSNTVYSNTSLTICNVRNNSLNRKEDYHG
jgi:D-glycerate 3-kinase